MLLLPFDSTYSQPIDLYEIELGITILFSFVYALLFFTFPFVSSFFFWSVGYHVWAGHLDRGVSERAQVGSMGSTVSPPTST